MDPTRPIDSKIVREPGSRTVARPQPVPDATHPSGGSPGAAAEVSESVFDAGKAISEGRAAAKKLDASTLASLQDRVASGDYRVDIDALAERILDDAFGDEAAA